MQSSLLNNWYKEKQCYINLDYPQIPIYATLPILKEVTLPYLSPTIHQDRMEDDTPQQTMQT